MAESSHVQVDRETTVIKKKLFRHGNKDEVLASEFLHRSKYDLLRGNYKLIAITYGEKSYLCSRGNELV